MIGAALAVGVLIFTNLPVPRRLEEVSLVSQEYLPQQSIKLRIDTPKYLLVKKSEPLRVDLVINKSVSDAIDTALIASARLEAPDLVTASEETYEPLFPALQASFSWVVIAGQPGDDRGVVWIYLQRRGEEGKNHEVLLAHPVELNVLSIFGLPTRLIIWIGIIGLGLSVGLVMWGARRSGQPKAPGFYDTIAG